jgi:hypothetical protein
MRKILFVLALSLLALGPRAALAAEEWGLPNEQTARFEAKVVDILCELSGDCPAQCGAGKRQLGLLRDDGTLVLAMKNAGAFTGASNDLIGFCGRRVVADGLLAEAKGTKIFALQFVRLAPDGPWDCANMFVRDWAKANGKQVEDCGFNEWFREDPTIKALIDEQGKLGLKKQ